MKKITLLLFFAALPFISCSSDDGGSKSKRRMKATIDGTAYTFNTFTIEQIPYNDNGFVYTDVHITGSVDNDPGKTVSIVVMKGEVGNGASWYFGHSDDFEVFVKDENFVTNVSESTDSFVKGTFSGNVVSETDGEVRAVTNGDFEIRY